MLAAALSRRRSVLIAPLFTRLVLAAGTGEPDHVLGDEDAGDEQGRAGQRGGSRRLVDSTPCQPRFSRPRPTLAGRAVVTPRDLADEHWIATPEGSICRQWLLRMYDGTGRFPRIAHVAMGSSTATWPWSAPGSASRSSPGSAARPLATT